MNEKIIEICKAVEIHIQKSEEYQACIGIGRFTERFNEIIHVLNPLVNQEVEKRIAERMPSELVVMRRVRNRKDFLRELGYPTQVLVKHGDAIIETIDWLRSRLTNDSQKTEGGGE